MAILYSTTVCGPINTAMTPVSTSSINVQKYMIHMSLTVNVSYYVWQNGINGHTANTHTHTWKPGMNDAPLRKEMIHTLYTCTIVSSNDISIFPDKPALYFLEVHIIMQRYGV